jgi:exodeoxyribonuclease VII large subunit
LEQLQSRLWVSLPGRLAQLRRQWVGQQAALDPIRWKERVQGQQEQLAQLRQRLLSGLTSRCWRERPQLTSWTSQLPQLVQHQVERERTLWKELSSRLRLAGARLGQGEAARQQQWQARLKTAMLTLLKSSRNHFQPLQTGLPIQFLRLLEQQRGEAEQLKSLLVALSPERPLQLGYALVRDGQGNLVSSVNGRKAHEAVEIALADGHLDCRIEHIRALPGSRTTA